MRFYGHVLRMGEERIAEHLYVESKRKVHRWRTEVRVGPAVCGRCLACYTVQLGAGGHCAVVTSRTQLTCQQRKVYYRHHKSHQSFSYN